MLRRDMDMPMQRAPKHYRSPSLLEAHDVGYAGAKRLKGNAIYGKAEGASRGAGNLLVFTMVKHQSTTSHIREQWLLQAQSS